MKNNKALVIGSNASNSLSPLIFNYWFLKYSIAGEYGFVQIKKEKFQSKIKKIIKQKNICGLNVTIPFKEKIIPYLDELDEHSRGIGAVNCITIKKNKLYGSNTDWVGYTRALEETAGSNTKNKEALIIGYGGAAKAVLYALLRLEYKTIRIFNRSPEKLKKINNKRVRTHTISEIKEHIRPSTLLINTTPTNIFKNSNIPTTLPPNVILSDVVYRPRETEFLKYFKNPKSKIYGISMLINQAAPCFKGWFGIMPKKDRGLFEIINKEIDK